MPETWDMDATLPNGPTIARHPQAEQSVANISPVPKTLGGFKFLS